MGKDILDRTRNLIARGNIKAVIESLKLFTEGLEDKELFHRLLILSSRYTEWEEKENHGLIDYSYSMSFKNRITNDLLSLAQQINELKQEDKPVIQLKIDGEIIDFDSEKKRSLLEALKDLLGLSEEEIEIENINKD